MNEQFLEEFNLWQIDAAGYYKKVSERLSENDKIENLLSLAFQSAATLDSALYEDFEPPSQFAKKTKLIRKETLRLLHEKRGWIEEDDE